MTTSSFAPSGKLSKIWKQPSAQSPITTRPRKAEIVVVKVASALVIVACFSAYREGKGP
jgi:hypothetical protein